MNLIAISLFGTDELYMEGAVANARLVPKVYPGWTMRAYCSPEVPVIDLLRSLDVDVRIVPWAPGHAGLFWRFWPAAEPEIDYVIVRDADSRLNVREAAAVDAWIKSGRPFHVMRDHAWHRREAMLAGMWGFRGGSIPDIRGRVARFENGATKKDEANFLRDEMWPVIKDRCLVHSSVPEPLGGDPFPPHAPFKGFVGEVVDPNPEPENAIALLIPSRGRPAAALAAARSARETASVAAQLRIAVGVEPEDADSYRQVFGDDATWIHVLQAGGSYVRAIRELHRSVTAGIYGLCADDFVFETLGWDNRIRRAVASLPERLGLVYGDDGIQRERIATAPFLTAEWIAHVGEIIPGGYEHMFCDTELTDIAGRAGLLRFLPQVKITHRHYITGRAEFDSIYERSFTTMVSGRAEYTRRDDERQRLADSLANATGSPMLSILIPSLVQRSELLDELLASLGHQHEAMPDRSVVEIVVEPDAGERSPAAKRNSLLARARGTWVAFLEDDDVVADDSLALILRALEQDPDCVTFGGSQTPSGSSQFAHGTSSRIFAIRRSIALAVARKDANGPEDFKWSGAISPLLKSEVKIDKIPYHHRFESSKGTPRAAARKGSSRRGPAHGFPTPAQELLLTAAFGRDDIALRAWERWDSEVGPELADPASTRLLPLVWWNLQRLGASGVEVNRLKPFYWNSWATSQARIQLAGEAAAAFQKAGVPTLLLKGVALASRYYAKPELRPMGDVDLMVPAASAEEARHLLISSGWRPIQDLPESALRLLHGVGFEDREGRLLDLHWHALHESLQPRADDGFWARAETVEVGGTSTRILAPADQILHVSVHGLRWAKVPAIHWVADVMAIIESSADRIDWDLLVAEAQSRRVLMQVRGALDYVRGAFGVTALEPVCRRLNSVHSTLGDRVDYQVRTAPPSVGRDILLYWFDHNRLHAGASWPSRILGFPGYLRGIWGLRSLTQVPVTAARKSAQRLRAEVRRA